MNALKSSEAGKNLDALLKETAESHEPIQIQGNLHTGVLVSDEDWRAIQETLYLSSIPGMKESIVKGLKTPISKYAKGLDCGSCN